MVTREVISINQFQRSNSIGNIFSSENECYLHGKFDIEGKSDIKVQ